MRISDWSSDVCSSDLPADPFRSQRPPNRPRRTQWRTVSADQPPRRIGPFLSAHRVVLHRGTRLALRRTRCLRAARPRLFPLSRPVADPEGYRAAVRAYGAGLGDDRAGAGRDTRLPPVRPRRAGRRMDGPVPGRSEEHTAELQSLMRISYPV